MNNSRPDLRDRTFNYARRIVRLFCALPKTDVARILGKQFLRSGTSVGANYREAYRGRSRNEFQAITGICLKEIEETDYWLSLLAAENIIKPKRLESLLDETRQLIAIFVTITKNTKYGKPPEPPDSTESADS